MPETPVTRARLPVGRLLLLAAVVLAGLALFLLLSHRTPIVVEPVGVEARP